MSTKKLIREVSRVLERDGFTLVEVGARGNAHIRLVIRDGERSGVLTMPASPRSSEATVVRTLADARRYIRRGVA